MAINKKNLAQRAVTVVFTLAILAVVVLLLPKWYMHLVLAVIGLLGVMEFDRMANGFGYRVYKIPVMLFILLGIGSIYLPWFNLLMLPYLSFAMVCLISLVPPSDFTKSLPQLGISIMATGYLALSLVSLAYIYLLEDASGKDMGRILICFCLLMTWVGDITAFFAGSLFGKHKIAPKASPNKTWEGTAGNLVGNYIAAYVAKVTVLPQLDQWDLIFFTLVFGLLGFWGDLVESTWKRGARMKDSGTMLPGHGGFLDRTDSIFLTAPVFYYYMKTVVLAG